MTEFSVGDHILVLGKIQGVIAHIYPDDGVKITVREEGNDRAYYTVVPPHWIERR